MTAMLGALGWLLLTLLKIVGILLLIVLVLLALALLCPFCADFRWENGVVTIRAGVPGITGGPPRRLRDRRSQRAFSGS